MNDAPSQSQDKFIIRLPNGMRERIKIAADANNRSMNAEIVASLREMYPEPEPDDAGREFLESFEAWPKETRDRFLREFLNRVPVQDIEDGLIPGVVIRKD